MTPAHHTYSTLVSSPLYDPPRIRRTASTRRRANRRVTLKPKRRLRTQTARLYIDGAPAARGFVADYGVEWVAFYDVPELFDVDESGRVVHLGWMP